MNARDPIVTGNKIVAPPWRRCIVCFRPVKPEDDVTEKPYCPPTGTADCRAAELVEVTRSKLRVLAFRRDAGRCHVCNIDCVALRQEIDEKIALGGWDAYFASLAKSGFDMDALLKGRPLFEVDHDPPLVKGGTNTLEGVKTKCLSCHKAVTKDLATGRARARRPGGWGRR